MFYLDSLRTSHTWTDGADDKSKIPFVKPHPPKEPSSGHVHRRRPRVKSAGSAGKERTLSTSSASGHGSRGMLIISRLTACGWSLLCNRVVHPFVLLYECPSIFPSVCLCKLVNGCIIIDTYFKIPL